MELEVYCDESGLEALARIGEHRFSAIGSIWIPASYREEFKHQLIGIKHKNGIYGELKWNKVSPSYLIAYKEIVDFFFESNYIRSRVILIQSSKVDNCLFNKSDSELGFYKFYYQLLHHWILDLNTYSIFMDLKINRDKNRLRVLRRVLENSNLLAHIKQVQGLPSEQSLGIQLADIITGLVAAKFNNEIKSNSAKHFLIEHIEQYHIRKAITPTPRQEEKLNVFMINLQEIC